MSKVTSQASNMGGKFITRDVSGMVGSGGGKFINANEKTDSSTSATPGSGKFINANGK